MTTSKLPNAGRLLGALGALGTVAWAVSRWRRPPPPGPRVLRVADAKRLLGDERVAMVAHELRTPFGAIRHAAAALEAADDQRPHVRAACAIIRRQTEQVGRLLDDLVLPPGTRAQALALRLAPVDLTAVVTEIVEGLRGLVEERGHRLTLAAPDGSIVVLGDADRLAQVVTNLVWNAAKFTPAGGHVRVTVAREGKESVVRVRDNGIGISPALRDRIFRLFARAAPPGDNGRGIGLSLVELIVARHGGRVSVHSDGPGCGSEFAVRLPDVADASPTAATGDTVVALQTRDPG
jgi:signal transduction histidine kinase